MQPRLFTRRCTKCLLPENYHDIHFDIKGVCDFCLGKKQYGLQRDPEILRMMEHKPELLREFEETIERHKGSGEYDCLLLLSGGKDSSYLAWMLAKKYGLKVLALTVDTGMMRPVAKCNIRRVSEMLDMDHVFVRPRNNFFKKLYRFSLFNPLAKQKLAGGTGYSGFVCGACSSAIHGIALNEAVKRNIGLVTGGLSPDQIKSHFYEIPRHRIMNNTWLPEGPYDKFFDSADIEYFWSPEKIPDRNDPPRLVFPFHVMDWATINNIPQKVIELGLIEKSRASPLVTNCRLFPLLIFLDIRKLGYNPYVGSASHKIRQKGAGRRLKTILGLDVMERAVKTDLFRTVFGYGIRNVLDHLDIGPEEFLELARQS